MINVNGNGAKIVFVAAQSFPIGFQVSEFADDIDPLVAEELESVGYEMLYDGSLFAFDKAAAIILTVGVIAGGDDDMNFKIMMQSKRSNTSLLPFQNSVSAVITYPDGGRVILTNGALIKGAVLDSVSSDGRKKGNSYKFAFGSFTGAQSKKQLIAGVANIAAGLI